VKRAFSDYPPELQAAVNAYDESRMDAATGSERPMSDANKAHIAPMIMAAIRAYVEASR
jgi:hypothetical protein